MMSSRWTTKEHIEVLDAFWAAASDMLLSPDAPAKLTRYEIFQEVAKYEVFGMDAFDVFHIYLRIEGFCRVFQDKINNSAPIMMTDEEELVFKIFTENERNHAFLLDRITK